MGTKKENMLKDATAQFITKPKTQEPKKAPKAAADPLDGFQVPKGYKLTPEAKTKRAQILVTPTIYDEVKEIAQEDGKSFNEVVNNAITSYLEERKGLK